MRLDWKIYSIAAGMALLLVSVLLLEKFFLFILITAGTALLAFLLGFAQPVKYLGVELVTLTTMLVGVVYGPLLGGVYGFTMLLAHLILGRYYIGSYLMWTIPEYAMLGVLSGIFRTGILGPVGLSLIVSVNLLSLVLTFIAESERAGKELPYVVGNIVINSILFIQFFRPLVESLI